MSLINVLYNDKSATVSTNVGSTGATVISSRRGGAEPVYFNAKETSRIIDYFGIPDTGNEAIDDILNFNDSYPLWVSAPSTGSKYAGVLVTKTGTVPFIGGKDSKVLDFSEIDNEISVAETPNGTLTEFSAAVEDPTKYVAGSIGIMVDGVAVELTVSTAEPEVITSDVGSGTYTAATGAFSFTFDTAPSAGTVLAVTYKSDYSADAYFAIYDKNPQVSDLQVKVESEGSGTFSVNLQKTNWKTGLYKDVVNSPFTGSIVANTKDGFGNNIYFPILLQDNDYISVAVNEDIAFSTFTDDTSYVAFAGGLRGTTSTSDLTAGYDYFKNVNKYKADIFFDTTCDTGIPALYQTLRNSYQKYSYYICHTANANVEATLAAITALITDNKGIAFYWGHGKVINNYTGGLIASTLMGRVALRYADMYDVYNGLAPAWYNENGTHGGQLGAGIVEMFYDASDSQQELLGQARVNPIVMHPTFGVVITRERTSQSLNSDYASIGHTRLVDYIVSNIVDQVLPFQLYKLNDYAHRTRVSNQCELILSPLVADPYNLLREYAVKCDEENNNDAVLAREEFIVAIAIKFTPFSKKITLIVTNSAQGTSVEEDV